MAHLPQTPAETPISDTTAFAAAKLLAHHPASPRLHEPGANPDSFFGRIQTGDLLVDYEYGEHPVTHQWVLHVSAHWGDQSVFHATARSYLVGEEQHSGIVVHTTEPGPWRARLLSFVRERHAQSSPCSA